MKISDRDKKLILGVLLICIIALPIFFFIRPTNEKIKQIDSDMVAINERYEYLKDLYAKKDDYEAKIEELKEERTKMIDSFSEGIRTENTIMFLRGIELSDKPVKMSSMSFADPVEVRVTEDSVENGEFVQGLVALESDTSVEYRAQYSDIKSFLYDIFNIADRSVISSISMSLNPQTNEIIGIFVYKQYAITGEGRELAPATIPDMQHGTDRVFRISRDENGNPFTPDGVAEEENNEETPAEN